MANLSRSDTKVRERNSNETRAAILDAVRHLISESGNVDFSLSKVAEISGKNAALVSYHFGGKEQMLLAVIRDDESMLLDPLSELAARQDLGATEKLKFHIKSIVRLYAKKPYLSVLIRTLVRRSDEKTARDLINEQARPVISFQKDILQKGVREGVFRDIDHFSFYMMIMGAIEYYFAGVATIKYGFDKNPSDRKLQDQYAEAIYEAALRSLAN